MIESRPDDFYDFAHFPDPDGRLKELAELAEEENWDYVSSDKAHLHPILLNYIKFTYRRLAEENKIVLSENGQYACFNTGLVHESQEPIYASFEVNRQTDGSPWYFKGWFRRGQWELNRFPELPEIAHYFDDPSCLVFDVRKDFRVNVEHIIEENKERFSEPYQSMDNYQLQTFLKGAIDNAKERVHRNYKTAIPQYYRSHIQLLLPLCLAHPQIADLALVVERIILSITRLLV